MNTQDSEQQLQLLCMCVDETCRLTNALTVREELDWGGESGWMGSWEEVNRWMDGFELNARICLFDQKRFVFFILLSPESETGLSICSFE